MKIISVRVNNASDRENMVIALANNRYKVWVDKQEWVYFEIKDTGIIEENKND